LIGLIRLNNGSTTFTTAERAEFLVVKVKIIRFAKGNSGLVNDAGSGFAGKKAQLICQNYAIIVG
jgi:hypothetical protein